jgi:hypothetical protein
MEFAPDCRVIAGDVVPLGTDVPFTKMVALESRLKGGFKMKSNNRNRKK